MLWKKFVIFSTKFTDCKKGKRDLKVFSVCPINAVKFSCEIALDNVLNWLEILGTKYEIPINNKAPAVEKVIRTENPRANPFFSKKSTMGLKIMAIKIDTISMARIDEKR